MGEVKENGHIQGRRNGKSRVVEQKRTESRTDA